MRWGRIDQILENRVYQCCELDAVEIIKYQINIFIQRLVQIGEEQIDAERKVERSDIALAEDISEFWAGKIRNVFFKIGKK